MVERNVFTQKTLSNSINQLNTNNKITIVNNFKNFVQFVVRYQTIMSLEN